MDDSERTLSPGGNPSINRGDAVDRRHVLPFHQRLGYSVGHVQNDLCSAIWFTYLLVFMVSVLDFGQKAAGILLLIGQVADAVATPFVGIESDRNLDWALCKYGKRKTWHLLGTVCVLLSFPMIFNDCIGCSHAQEESKMVYYSSFIVIFQFGWASVQISHLSLIPDLTPISSERIGLNAFRYAFTVASNVLVYVITWSALRLNVRSDSSQSSQIGPQDLFQFRNVAFIVVAIGGVFSIIFHVLVKERKERRITDSIEEGPASLVDYSLPSNHLKWRHWFRVPQFYKIGLLYMFTRLTINLTQVYTPFYLQYNLFLDRESIAYIPLVMYVSGFMFSFFIKYINQKAGRKLTYFIGCAIALAAFSWVFFGNSDDYKKYEIYGVAILIGVSGSTMLITSLGITNDLIGHNTSSGAFVFGAMSFLDKLSNGIAVMVIQLHHPCAKHTCAGCCDYYRKILSLVCGGATVLGLVTLISLLPNKIGEISLERSENSKEPNVESEPSSDSDTSPLLRPSDNDKVIN